MTHPDVAAEQAHVDHAYARLNAMRAAEAERLHEAFEERGGTFQSVTERDIRVRNSLSRLEQLQIGREALVFGRIDRTADNDGETEPFHIGRLAISDDDQEPLVVDWRAPVAEPFYRATGAHPMGLRRRRHFLVDGQRLLDLQDELFGAEGGGPELGLSGSEVLIAALERSRTGRMRDIVATVQREQDEVIRAPLAGVMVVQGGPGTGKTAVALHRAAYLLYTYRFPLEQQGVLVVGPNPTFLRYIEQVLPSLGETGVELTTVQALFGDVKVTGTDAEAVARLKGDPRMATVVARAVRNRERRLRRTVEIPYGRYVLRVTREASAQLVSAAQHRAGTHNARRRVVETLLWRHLQAQIQERAGASEDVEGGDVADVDHDAAAELGRELRRRADVAEALDRMWPVLSPQELLHDLFGAQPLIHLAAEGVLSAEERRLLHRGRSPSLEAVTWAREDIPLLDEARALLGPVGRRTAGAIRTYGHIVVDEAQDLSPMQLRMLARRSLSGSMTVVGDIAQATGPWAAPSWDGITAHLPATRSARRVELTVNYRTPSEVMELAARVLAAVSPETTSPVPIRDSGQQPRIIAAERPALASTVAQAVSPDEGGITAVIVPPSLLDEVAAGLTRAGMAVGRAGEDALDTPVALLAVEDAKGLEFDTVIVVEPAAVAAESSQGLHALYVALTRATQRLTLVHAGPLPAPLVG
ncbi:MAG: AAA family ATPase [Acidimicrobiaceae bacterium]|nr:AAA family ATPase [Acidimicrobiaceae bacterium]